MARQIKDSVSTRVAKARRSRLLRLFGSRAMATITLGAALSVGGATEALQGVHFLVQKDLDSVRVLKSDGRHAKVVANLSNGFAANSLFKLTRALPESIVSRKITLFSDNWIPPADFAPPAKARMADVFHSEMARINDSIRHDFFANAVPFGDLIHEKAQKYDVDPALVAAVVETESRFHPQAVSAVGARGLMQLMPRTGQWMGATNLYDPEQNVDAGVRYLKYLQDRFDGNLNKAIAAYNGGEGNVQRYGGVPPFQETRTYVKKVLGRYEERQRQLKKYEHDLPASVASADGVATLR